MSLAGLFSWVMGTAVDVFYRRRILPGGARLPSRGPILVVANHPNALVDPVLIQTVLMRTAGRRMRPLAKATLFKTPFLSLLARGMEALPVYRSKDGFDTRQNAETFRAVEAALVQGAAVLIFPEGISHDEPEVQPLKTGAARMALRAFEQGAQELLIVPVGLSYADKLRFRSTAAVDIGQPIRVADFAAEGEAAVRPLTEAIFQGLRQVTLNLESWEDLPLLEAVDAIWRLSEPERVRRLKVLADATRQLRQQDRPYLDDLRARLSEWLLRLQRLGLRPGDLSEEALQARRNPLRVARFTLHNLAALLIGLPFAALGALCWCLPFYTVHLVWTLWRPERDVGATVKVLAALILYPLWYALVLLGAVQFLPWRGWLALALLAPPAGMMTRHFFRRRGFAIQQLATYLQLTLRGGLQANLVREKQAFYDEIDSLARRVGGA